MVVQVKPVGARPRDCSSGACWQVRCTKDTYNKVRGMDHWFHKYFESIRWRCREGQGGWQGGIRSRAHSNGWQGKGGTQAPTQSRHRRAHQSAVELVLARVGGAAGEVLADARPRPAQLRMHRRQPHLLLCRPLAMVHIWAAQAFYHEAWWSGPLVRGGLTAAGRRRALVAARHAPDREQHRLSMETSACTRAAAIVCVPTVAVLLHGALSHAQVVCSAA